MLQMMRRWVARLPQFSLFGWIYGIENCSSTPFIRRPINARLWFLYQIIALMLASGVNLPPLYFVLGGIAVGYFTEKAYLLCTDHKAALPPYWWLLGYPLLQYAPWQWAALTLFGSVLTLLLFQRLLPKWNLHPVAVATALILPTHQALPSASLEQLLLLSLAALWLGIRRQLAWRVFLGAAALLAILEPPWYVWFALLFFASDPLYAPARPNVQWLVAAALGSSCWLALFMGGYALTTTFSVSFLLLSGPSFLLDRLDARIMRKRFSASSLHTRYDPKERSARSYRQAAL